MKTQLHIFLIGFLCISTLAVNGQRLPSGGGEYVFENSDNCLSPDQRQEIQNQIKVNVNALKKQGVIAEQKDNSIVSFAWPTEKDPALSFNNYYGIVNYVDQDNTFFVVGDYNCLQRSYDGHKGTDISTWPFPWYQYDNDYVSIVSAADGIIVFKQDGNPDNSCSWPGSTSWNAVFVQHTDGSVAWYGHMKENGLTSKGFGDSIEQGEFLGYMASSGYSTGPHLHFEVYDSEDQLIDPYSGSCNNMNYESWWFRTTELL